MSLRDCKAKKKHTYFLKSLKNKTVKEALHWAHSMCLANIISLTSQMPL